MKELLGNMQYSSLNLEYFLHNQYNSNDNNHGEVLLIIIVAPQKILKNPEDLKKKKVYKFMTIN